MRAFIIYIPSSLGGMVVIGESVRGGMTDAISSYMAGDDHSREFPVKTVYPKIGDEPSFFCCVLVRFSAVFCSVLRPVCLLREFPC